MSNALAKRYIRAEQDRPARIVVLLPVRELEALDAWGVPAGMKSRTAAIRTLLRKGLEAVGSGQTTGNSLAG